VVLPVEFGTKACYIDDWDELAPEELEKMITENHNIGIRLDGLTVLDLERKELIKAFFNADAEVIAKKTWVAETGKGYHVYLRGTLPGKETKRVKELVEFRTGNDAYVVAPPSLRPSGARYKWLSEVELIEISREREAILEKLYHMVEVLQEFRALILALEKIWTPSHRHYLAIWLSGCLRKSGVDREDAEIVLKAIACLANDEELEDRLRALEDTYKKPIDQIGAWSYLEEELRGIVGPEKAREIMNLIPRRESEVRVIDARVDEPSRPKTRFTVGGERLPDGSWVELVEKDGAPHLLIYKDGEFKVVESYEAGDAIYKPRPRLPFALPKAPERFEEDPALWEDTKAFVKEYFDVPDERAYDVIVAAIAWSYFYRAVADSLPNASTPYLQFLGPWRSGKTRALEVFRAVAHRAVQVVDPSEAAIFRMIELFKPTLVIDEANVLDPNILAIMAAAYRKGQFVPRADRENPNEVHLYDVFSFIIYATREQIRDDIFSRSVTIYCEKALRPTAKLIDENRAAELRTRWFAQYLRLRDQVRVTYTEYESEDGRLQELFSPLLVMARLFGNPDAEKNIESYGRKIEERIRGLETASDEAAVVEAIVKLIGARPGDAPEYLLTSEIAKAMADGEGNGPDPRWVGRIMHQLGFAKIKTGDGKRGYRIDYDLLTRLTKRYNITWTLSLTLGPKPGGGSSPLSGPGREGDFSS
jgi:hypothetical protein